MALECAHCGARAPDGAPRCPQCLRSTGLITAPDEEGGAKNGARAPGRNARIALIAVLAVGVSAGVAALSLRALRAGPGSIPVELPPGVNASDVPAALEAGPAMAPLVSRARTFGDAPSRARAVGDAVKALAGGNTGSVTNPDNVQPARSPDGIYRALTQGPPGITSLDLARLECAALVAAGTPARVGERTAGVRSDEPADPSGLMGSYVVLLDDGSALDVNTQTVLPRAEVHARPVEGRALLGAMLAQTALAQLSDHAPHAARERVLALADGAVSAWPDGPTPLAVRARAWELVGASGGASLADQDLASAISLRDDAALHLLRARLAVRRGDVQLAATESLAAANRAPAFGEAALAKAVFASVPGALPDAGDACAGLAISREAWTNDALALCRHEGDEGALRSAAERLRASGSGPLRLAYAAAAGARSAVVQVSERDRAEFGAWLGAMGRGDLARELVGSGDAGR